MSLLQGQADATRRDRRNIWPAKRRVRGRCTKTGRYLTGDYFRDLHVRPLYLVSQRDIAARLVVLEREKGAPTARRARGVLSAMYVWAMRSGIVTINPAIGTPAPAVAPGRSRVLSNDELERIWRACGDDDHGRIIRLLIFDWRAPLGNW